MINVQKISPPFCAPSSPFRALLMSIGGPLVSIGVLLIASLLALLLTSCRTTRYVPMPSSHTRDSTLLSVYTQADSIREYVHDSMSIRIVSGFTGISGIPRTAGIAGQPPDTVYVDRWHTAYKDRYRYLNHRDTIIVTRRDSIPYPVYIPSSVPSGKVGQGARLRFYRSCTLVLLLLVLGIILYILFQRTVSKKDSAHLNKLA